MLGADGQGICRQVINQTEIALGKTVHGIMAIVSRSYTSCFTSYLEVIVCRKIIALCMAVCYGLFCGLGTF